MKKCLRCGTDNFDAAQFCSHCGAPLPMPAPMPQNLGQQKTNKRNNLLIVISVSAVCILILLCLFLFTGAFGSVGETERDTVVIMTRQQPADVSATAPAAPAVETPAKTAPAEPASNVQKYTASGNIEGYPFSMNLTIKDGKVKGTYRNEYNGTKMKVSGSLWRTSLEMTLSSGSAKCYFTFNTEDGSYFYGDFHDSDGYKEASLTLTPQ